MIGCLKTNRDKRIDDLAILSIVDLFLTRSPRVLPNAKRSSVQTLVLQERGWNGEKVKQTIEKTLFDDGLEFCRHEKSFAVEARKRGLYFDDRLKKAKAQAFLLQEGTWNQKPQKTSQTFAEKESKADCFFRHLRNAIAHGAIYKLPQGRCAFIDRSGGNKGALTAYVVTTIGRLDKLRTTLLDTPNG